MVVEAGATVGLGIAANILDRAGQGLLAHLSRITDLNRVFQAGTLTASKRKSVGKHGKQEIERIFGQNSSFGVERASFLDALKNSTFLDQLCANTYLNQPDPGAEALFRILVNTH